MLTPHITYYNQHDIIWSAKFEVLKIAASNALPILSLIQSTKNVNNSISAFPDFTTHQLQNSPPMHSNFHHAPTPKFTVNACLSTKSVFNSGNV
tara:strand:- start:3681 stop:3962 length:282 start_codon:yes stop_codon:yes gene_type:complete